MSIIIDVGCYHTKFGFSLDETPQITPTCILNESGVVEYFVDSNGQLVSDHEKLEHLIGKVMECYDGNEYPVVLCDNPSWNRNFSREIILEILFEKFSVPSVNIVNQAELIMVENGRTNGCVLSSGHGNSYAVVIKDGKCVSETLVKSELGGRNLSEYLRKLILENRGVDMSQSREFISSLSKMKETLCLVSTDFSFDTQQAVEFEESFELPDGTSIIVGIERFKSTEELFYPTLTETFGFSELVFTSIEKLDLEWRRDSFSNIVLAGGTTMIPRFMERLKSDIKNMIHSFECERLFR